MQKIKLNLIIIGVRETALLKHFKIILPLVAGFLFLIFVIAFGISLLYVNKNITEFNRLKKEAEKLNQDIAVQKNIEGVYTITAQRVSVLAKLLDNYKNFSNLISEIQSLNSDNIKINASTFDQKGDVAFSLVASNSASLDNFVSLLLVKENKKSYSGIRASAINRNKKGGYNLNISFKAADSFYH